MKQESDLHQRPEARGLWHKLPVWLRAILLGFFVNTLGVGIWVLIVQNIPPPWSPLCMIILLIIYVRYYSGSWSSGRRQKFQQLCFRETRLPQNIWAWGGIASLCLIIFLNAGLVLTFRFQEFQPEIFKTATYLDSMNPLNSWSLIIVASLVAGICEEVGFRGYMQTPMEKKYGPFLGITITSFVFVVVHLHQAWAGGILIQIFIISFMIGFLAYATNSLIPGIIAHTLFDVVNFSYWWSNIAGTFTRKPVSITGIDSHFIITLFVVLATATLFTIAIYRMIHFTHNSKKAFTPN